MVNPHTSCLMVVLQSTVVARAKAGDEKLEETSSLTCDGCRPANSTFSRQLHSNTTSGVQFMWLKF